MSGQLHVYHDSHAKDLLDSVNKRASLLFVVVDIDPMFASSTASLFLHTLREKYE